MASIAGAAAASTLWCLYTHEEGGLAGIALDYVFIVCKLGLKPPPSGGQFQHQFGLHVPTGV
jgi:hypothetical protein